MNRGLKMFRTIKYKLARLFYPLAFIWWRLWSNIYRFLFHRKYKEVILPRNMSYIKASEEMVKLKWAPDKAMQLWDVVGSPRWVQHCINQINEGHAQPLGAMDCDEFSCWAANVVHAKYIPAVFCFAWYDEGKNKLHGHAMCWIKNKDGKYFHIGNWGLRGPYKNLREACSDILKYCLGCKPVGWALMDANLKVLKSGRGLPDKTVK
tara:strand:- start:1550 stop:2170 length:621 start_codon:yes stop_codon:yes gene_type:complete